MNKKLMKSCVAVAIFVIYLASLTSAATCPWFLKNELYTAQCGVTKEVLASSGILANDLQAVAVVNPESITIDPRYGTIDVSVDGSFTFEPALNIQQGTYVPFKYNATNGVCEAKYPGIAKFQISCRCKPYIEPIDTICLPVSLDEIRELLDEAGVGCVGCGDITTTIDLKDIELDSDGNPIAGIYSFCIKCPGCQLACGEIVIEDCGEASEEVCDGIDNDCDGVIDNGNPGGDESCDTGLPGECSSGTTACEGGAIICKQDNQASTEVCDGLDNDCDGQTDEDGVCCTPEDEVCDGIDNDCDGVIDNDNPGGDESCDTGLPGECSSGTTACEGGAIICKQDNQASTEVCDGLDNDCDGQTDEDGVCCTPEDEVCDGIDNDCDGVIDNGNPGGDESCDTGLPGECSSGTTACEGGAIICKQDNQASAEICDDGLDNDCDGLIDMTDSDCLGTGDVQVTLRWHAYADIDLWVTDPSGEKIYYAHPTSASGGNLDVDNMCGNFEWDLPENIFWPTGSAPSGSYAVQVDYYRDCGGAGSVDWEVTTLVRGVTNTYTGTITYPDEQIVTTFTVV